MDTYHVCIYPYCHECDATIDYAAMLAPTYEITALVSPKGWGLSSQKKFVGERELTIVSDFEAVTDSVDCIWIQDVKVLDSFIPIMLRHIMSCAFTIKKIICCIKLPDQLQEQLQTWCDERGCTLSLYVPIDKQNIVFDVTPNNLLSQKELQSISVPVILIAGLWEELDKFYCSLALRDAFQKAGYTVSQIGSKAYCELFGFHSFPAFMAPSANLNGMEQIWRLNQYVSSIIRDEKPDVMLITIPGALQDYSDKFTSGHGLLSYLVCQAVSIDFFLLCGFYNFNPEVKEFYSIISEASRFRLGCEIDCVHMSNLFIDQTASMEKKEIVCNRLSRQEVDSALSSISDSVIPIYNLMEKKDQNDLFQQIIRKLAHENVEVI